MNKRKILAIFFLGAALSACGGDDNDPNNRRGNVEISGTAAEDETLTATVSDGNGVSEEDIAYEWLADDVIVSGADSSTFVLSDEQVGSSITVIVDYVDGDGFAESITSSATAAVSGINDTGTISISGNPVVGDTLTAAIIDEDGVSTTVNYQWQASGADISGATSATFTPSVAHIDSTLTVSAVYTDDQGFSESLLSSATSAVTTTAVNAAGTLTVSGTTTVNESLTASLTDSNGTTSASITYTWLANNVAISGATSNTYTLTTDEIGDTITVQAAYTDDDGFTENPESSATAAIAPAVVNSLGSISITGSTIEAETLTAAVTDANGTSTSSITYTWLASNVAISGANSNTYTLTADEVGDTITVRADYTDDDGFEENTESSATAAIAAAVVNSVGMISITGSAVEAETLSASVTDDNGTSTATITYSWSADGTLISGATSSTYTLTAAEVGASITASASYTDDDGFTESISSSPTPTVIAENSPGEIGTISGTATEGETLTAGGVSDANGISNATLSYQWAASGTDISSATNSTYTLTSAEVGETITVKVTYTDDDGYSESLTSEETAAVAAATTNTEGSVNITGTAAVGETLTATITDPNGTTGASFSYEWRADGSAINGANSSTFNVSASELGTEITVNVTYTDDGDFDEDITSSPTAAVIPANTSGTIAPISGTATQGQTLNAGSVSDANGVSTAIFTYQWAADGSPISGATSTSYTLTAAEVGTTITVSVTYTDDDGYDESITSAATSEVVGLVNSEGTVAITSSGSLLVGDTLTAAVTDANGTSGSSFAFQWQADDVDITDATSSTFTLTTAEAGSVITVNVSYTDDDAFAESISSEAATGVDTTHRVFSALASDATELASALAAANEGDWIVLSGGADDYTDIGEIEVDTAVTLTKTVTSLAEISGAMCLVLSADDTTVDGLTFSDIDWISGGTCDGENNASIYLGGDGITLSNNTFASESATVNSDNTTNNWVVVEGSSNIITRNTFIGKDTNRKGGFISVSASTSGGSRTDHIIEYNLFKDTVASDSSPDSSAYAIQLGSTTGTDSNNASNFTVRYNRFENLLGGRRLMRVQTSNATIEGNTVVDSFGAISLEDGQMNMVQDNIIIRTTSTGTSDDASGILAHRFGHTISNNYIAGLHTNDKTLGGIVFSVNELGEFNAGLAALAADTTTDFTMTVEQNTVLNSEQPIVFSESWPDDASGEDCADIDINTHPTEFALTHNTFIVNFDNNLIINGLDTDPSVEGAYLDADVSTSDHTIEYDCDLLDYDAPGVSAFSNNHSFTDSRVAGSASGAWTQVSGNDGNEFGGSDRGQDQSPTGNDIAEFESGNEGLIEGIGGEAGIGADTSMLDFIETDDVGANSTWVFDS